MISKNKIELCSLQVQITVSEIRNWNKITYLRMQITLREVMKSETKIGK